MTISPFQGLYIFSLLAIYKSSLLAMSCYKIMFILGGNFPRVYERDLLQGSLTSWPSASILSWPGIISSWERSTVPILISCTFLVVLVLVSLLSDMNNLSFRSLVRLVSNLSALGLESCPRSMETVRISLCESSLLPPPPSVFSVVQRRAYVVHVAVLLLLRLPRLVLLDARPLQFHQVFILLRSLHL